MKLTYTKLLFLLIAGIIYFAGNAVYAQGVTTSAINGSVVDENGEPLPSATVIAVHVPSGTQYGTTTRLNGKFNLLGLRVGGPYTITVSYVGYETQKKEDVYLNLGQTVTLNFKMTTSAVKLSEITVVGGRNAIISSSRTGAFQNVSAQQMEQVPTISRTFQNFAKLSPMFSGTNMQAAGRNNRYNNIQIDGTQYNDLFGLGSSGTPGGQTGANPISLDAIDEFQVVIAPYDVRYGGFTGGGINAITRSGTNFFKGSVYGYGRNQNLIGLSPGDNQTKYANFTDNQYGFRLGGPVVKDKLFFFTNVELTNHTVPLSNASITQGSGAAAANADTLRNILATKGFSAGSYNSFDVSQPSTKFFLRFDYNLSENNKLTIRNNFVHSYEDNLNARTSVNSLSFDSYNYRITNNTNSTVLQLNSTLGNKMSNELTLGYTMIRDKRGPTGAALPEVDVVLPGGFTIYAGTDRYSSANSLDQNIFEFTDNFTYLTGNHVFTFGTHNEFFNFKNLFIRSFYGYYQYKVNYVSQLNFNNPSFFQRVYSRTSDNEPAASFGVNQIGFYAQDEWSIAPNMKLTYGLRVDVPFFPNKPANNDSVSYYFPGYSTTDVPNGNVMWSPRVGFNWDVNGDHTTQVRGGIGAFAGRIPYVWMSNNYGNTGTLIAEVDGGPGTQFSADPYNQPGLGAPGTGAAKLQSEIDLVDPNLKMPQVLRFDVAVDHQLPYNITGTVEAQYTKTLYDMLYKEINLNPQVGSLPAPDGRPIFGGTNSGNHNFYGIYYLTNTTKGYQYDLSIQLQRNVMRGISGNVGYNFQRALDQNGVLSSQAQSQMRYNPISGNPNDPPLTTSDFEIRNRIFASLTYTHEFWENNPTSISLFYNGQSGQPFGFCVYGDVNNDGFNQNDLFYIPKNDADIELGTVKNGVYTRAPQSTYNALEATINGNDYLSSHRGQIAARNGANYPWRNELDLRIAQDIPAFMPSHHFQITIDILNVLNLINSKWGWDVSGGYNNNTIVSYEGIDKATGNAVYGFNPNYKPWNYNDLTSRWTMQLGARYTF